MIDILKIAGGSALIIVLFIILIVLIKVLGKVCFEILFDGSLLLVDFFVCIVIPFYLYSSKITNLFSTIIIFVIVVTFINEKNYINSKALAILLIAKSFAAATLIISFFAHQYIDRFWSMLGIEKIADVYYVPFIIFLGIVLSVINVKRKASQVI